MNNADDFKKFWNRIEDDLGNNDMNMRRDRPYCGQSHTDTGLRGKTEIKGVTFRDLRDCFIRAACLCSAEQFPELYAEAAKGDAAALCENDLFKLDLNKIDPMAWEQNLACEIERLMGIFPNIPNLE